MRLTLVRDESEPGAEPLGSEPRDEAPGPAPRRAARMRPSGKAIAVVAILLTLGAYLVLSSRAVPGAGELRAELKDQGRVAVVGGDDLTRLAGGGTETVMADELPALRAALAGRDEQALARAMTRSRVRGLLVDGRRGGDASNRATLAKRLGAYDHISVLQGVYVAPAAGYYVLAEPDEIEPPLDEALARVARRLLEGARTPRVQSFPEPLRRLRNVEVMVLLREGFRPRLWRSARASSIARGLNTAAVVARNRWIERQSAMGESIGTALPKLDVEVWLLREDGTLGDTSPRFIRRVFYEEHGVAYERRGAWRYMLPEVTAVVGRGSAVSAYQHLFRDYGLAAESFERTDLRFYRLVARLLVRSPATAPSRSSGSDALPSLRPSPPRGAAPSRSPSSAARGNAP